MKILAVVFFVILILVEIGTVKLIFEKYKENKKFFSLVVYAFFIACITIMLVIVFVSLPQGYDPSKIPPVV